MLRSVATMLLLIMVPGFGAPWPNLPAGAAHAGENWKVEFEALCGNTADSLSLTKDELRGLVARCDALKKQIEKLDESTAKVYLKRLRMCRDLFSFVLDSKSVK